MTVRVTLLGSSGAMGTAVAARLHSRGVEVVRASRATGVDAVTGAGLDRALAGADTVVDCLNRQAVSAGAAVGFFGAGARKVAGAARRAGVGHLVVLSIVGVTRPATRHALGYYAGKAAQEQSYFASGLPTTVVASTAWFSLAEQFLAQARLGPLALVPAMTLQPVHPDAVADLVVDTIAAAPPATTARRELAGPQRIRADRMARDLAAARGERVRVLGVPFPGKGFRESGLLPDPDTPLDERTFSAWLAETVVG